MQSVRKVRIFYIEDTAGQLSVGQSSFFGRSAQLHHCQNDYRGLFANDAVTGAELTGIIALAVGAHKIFAKRGAEK